MDSDDHPGRVGPVIYGSVHAAGYLGGVLLLFAFVLGARLLAAGFIVETSR